MTNYPQNTNDIIDSRDIIEAIDDLKHTAGPDEKDYLYSLFALQKEAEGYSGDWEYGATLVRDSYFQEYAEELAEDTGAINPQNNSWPLYCIDWEQAARDLKMDYTSVEFDGVTYWIR